MSLYTVLTAAEERLEQEETHDALGVGTARVVLRCSWADRHAIVEDILGNRREWPHGSGEKPRAHRIGVVPAPSCDGNVVLGQCISYDEALLTVDYSTDTEEDLVYESLEPQIEFITLDYKQFRWGSASGDPLIEAEAPGKQIRSMVLNRTLYDVEGPLPNSLLTLMGTCNRDEYYSQSLGLTFAKETLLYAPPSMSRTITTNQVEGWHINFKFPFQEFGWNKFWRADTQSWERIYVAGTGGSGSGSGAAGDIYYNYPLDDYSDFLF